VAHGVPPPRAAPPLLRRVVLSLSARSTPKCSRLLFSCRRVVYHNGRLDNESSVLAMNFVLLSPDLVFISTTAITEDCRNSSSLQPCVCSESGSSRFSVLGF
jgi:hypothetical protein